MRKQQSGRNNSKNRSQVFIYCSRLRRCCSQYLQYLQGNGIRFPVYLEINNSLILLFIIIFWRIFGAIFKYPLPLYPQHTQWNPNATDKLYKFRNSQTTVIARVFFLFFCFFTSKNQIFTEMGERHTLIANMFMGLSRSKSWVLVRAGELNIRVYSSFTQFVWGETLVRLLQTHCCVT